ncbi:hypothetical protein BDY24DRAFT_139480 [Mrakia frigida]|uniref:uncharacterized protein n=1 Tax=Mrakia frigida TaxID=29902 RepID=UPI003FCC251A
MPDFLPPLPLFTSAPISEPPKRPNSHRQLHLQNVLALLHLSLLRQDYPRARRAWKILATCREAGWEGIYRFEGALRRGLDEEEEEGEGKEREEWLEGLRRGGGREVIPLLQTYVYHLLALNPPQPTRALDTLEIYITSIPYAASPALHGLAALCALGKSLETTEGGGGQPPTYDHSTAKHYIHSALDLLPESSSSSSSSSSSDDDEPTAPKPTRTSKRTTSSVSTRAFYLSLSKLADEVSRWGPGGSRIRGRDGSESDSSSSESEGERKKSRRNSSASESGSGSEVVVMGEKMVEEESSSGEEEEKRDERHESLSAGEQEEEGGEEAEMMDLS